jgi:hypothetical protein
MACLAVTFQLLPLASSFVTVGMARTANKTTPRIKSFPSAVPVLAPIRPDDNHCYRSRSVSVVSIEAKQQSAEDLGDNNDNYTETASSISTSKSSSADSETTTTEDNFDGEGFANYLLPYAIALIGSVLATAAMFKFVLLDF